MIIKAKIAVIDIASSTDKTPKYETHLQFLVNAAWVVAINITTQKVNI